MSVEMSVDEPFIIDQVHQKEKSCSSTISYGSSGIDSGSKGKADDSQDDGKRKKEWSGYTLLLFVQQ